MSNPYEIPHDSCRAKSIIYQNSDNVAAVIEVSIVVGCQNRVSFLQRSVQSWLQHTEIKEILIVDWQSDESLHPLCLLEDKRIKVLHCQGGGINNWILSVALNFGIVHAKYPIVLKVDCDTILESTFFKLHQLKLGEFFAGDWRIARNKNESHLNGVILCYRADLLKINGYNEHIRTYGYDDTDLYDRLQKIGLRYLHFDLDSLSHHEHGNELRHDGHVPQEIVKNLYISQKHPWTHLSQQTKFEQKNKSQICSACNSVSWTPIDLQLNQLSPEQLQKCTTQQPLMKHVSSGLPLIFIIEPLNGLGNRLRALASAAILARHYCRQLQVKWLCDLHCEAQWQDLFDPIPHISFLPANSADESPRLLQHCVPHEEIHRQLSSAMIRSIHVAAACIIIGEGTNWSKESQWLRNNVRPILSLRQQIAAVRTRMKQSCKKIVGMHIRMGQGENHPWEDTSTWKPEMQRSIERARASSTYATFWHKITEIIGEEGLALLVCGDCPTVYHNIKNHHHANVEIILCRDIAEQRFDRSVLQIQQAVVDSWVLSESSLFLGSPWSSFTELISRLGSHLPVLIAGRDFFPPAANSKIKTLGLLSYPHSFNLGDNIQTLASKHAALHCGGDDLKKWPIVYLERDNQLIANPPLSSNQIIYIIQNGWFDGRLINAAWPTELKPLYLSFHLNESPTLFDDPSYNSLRKHQTSNKTFLLDQIETINYFKRWSPIGCRDQHTANKFIAKGISAYVTSCLTLTLRITWSSSLSQQAANNNFIRSGILVVDAHIGEKKSFQKLVPKHIRDRAIYKSHCLTTKLSNSEKEIIAHSLLLQYSTAQLVITNRLHCALPCLALYTPVVFILSKMDTDCRFDDTLKRILTNHANFSFDQESTWILTHDQIDLIDTLASTIIADVKKHFVS